MKFPFFKNLKFKEEKKVKKPAYREIGDSGVSKYEGIITEEYNTDLQGTDGITIYDKMRKSDATVKASVLVCTLPLRAASWYIEPADEDRKNQEVAELVENNLFGGMSITWDDFLRQALLMLPFGVMLFEKVFKTENNKILYKKLAPRLPKGVASWETKNKKDGITWSKIDGSQVSIPMEKLLILVNEKEGDNWWGNSILRASYKHWHFKNNYYKMDAVAFERQSLGIPKCKLPEQAGDPEEDKAVEILKNLRNHEKAYVIEPAGYEIEIMDMKGGVTKDPTNAINHHNRQILLSVLAQFLDLGSGATGSRALSQDQSSAFFLALQAVAKQVCDAVNNYVIPQLVDLNYTVEEYPKLKCTDIAKIDYNTFSTAIQRLAQVGAITVDESLEKHIRELFKLPEKEEIEEEKKPKVKETPETDELKKKASELRFQEPFKGWRELTFAEKKVHFKSIQEHFNQYEKEFVRVTTEILKKAKSKFLKEFENALKKKDKTALWNIALEYQGEYRTAIVSVLKKVFDFAKTNVAKEMGVAAPATPKSVVDRIELQSNMIAKKHADEIVYESKKAAVENLGKDKAIPVVMGAVGMAVTKKITEMVRDTGAIVVGGNINQGRRLVQQKYEVLIYALQRSEILDERTCDFCLEIDGRIFDKRDPFTRNDIFHSNCRGIWVEILKEEKEKPKITGAPASLTDRFGGEVNELIQPRK